ncbi:MAG: hypothetical protein GTN90_07455 [Xanthomonadales bacterium]|nr:hypothetical protein [Xanthomonadales bacterium]
MTVFLLTLVIFATAMALMRLGSWLGRPVFEHGCGLAAPGESCRACRRHRCAHGPTPGGGAQRETPP